MRLTTVLELALQAGIRFPRAVEQDLERAVVLRRPAISYGRSFAPWKRVIDKVTRIPENHYRITAEVAEDMARDGVRYAELRTSVRLPFDQSAFRTMLRCMDEAATDALREHGIDVRFLLGFNREQFSRVRQEEQLDVVRQVLDATQKFRHRVLGFDMWGNENRHPPRAFTRAFELLRGAGYALAIHAGETGNVEYVRQAIEMLQCRRIGHGGAMLQDPELVGRARDKEIGVEVCLTSNLLTGVVTNIHEHPLAGMVRAGLQVCLCADNTLVYDTTLSSEYTLAVRAGLMNAEQLIEHAETAASLTFLPADEQNNLVRRLRMDPARLTQVMQSLHGQ